MYYDCTLFNPAPSNELIYIGVEEKFTHLQDQNLLPPQKWFHCQKTPNDGMARKSQLIIFGTYPSAHEITLTVSSVWSKISISMMIKEKPFPKLSFSEIDHFKMKYVTIRLAYRIFPDYIRVIYQWKNTRNELE